MPRSATRWRSSPVRGAQRYRSLTQTARLAVFIADPDSAYLTEREVGSSDRAREAPGHDGDIAGTGTRVGVLSLPARINERLLMHWHVSD